MQILLLCGKIFFARILDVTIATFRQNIMLKGKMFVGAFLAFLEILIWFFIAREALLIPIHNLWIPISYSLGYATGTLLGAYLSKTFILKGEPYSTLANWQELKTPTDKVTSVNGKTGAVNISLSLSVLSL